MIFIDRISHLCYYPVRNRERFHDPAGQKLHENSLLYRKAGLQK